MTSADHEHEHDPPADEDASEDLAPDAEAGGAPLEPKWLAIVWVIGLALTLVLNIDALTEVPVWDAATGLFPAAITLSQNGFDLPTLMAQPGWGEGGPNTNSTSPVTLLTALALTVFSDPSTAVLALHLLHFLLSATLLTAVFVLARTLLSTPLSAMVTLGVATHPIYVVQTGAIYIELPLALCSTLALIFYIRGRHMPAILMSWLCLLLKTTGVTTVAVLLAALVLERVDLKTKAKRAGLLLLPGAIFASRWVLQAAAAPPMERPADTDWWSSYSSFVYHNIIARMELVPDVHYMILAVAALGVALLPRHLRALSSPTPEPSDTAAALIHFHALAFVCFFLTIAGSGVLFWMLPRYTVQILAFVLIVLAWVMSAPLEHARVPNLVRGIPHLALGGLLAASLLNQSGQLYPEYRGLAFSLVERDTSYRDLLTLQRTVAKIIVELPADVPKFYPRAMHYFVTYPELGYVDVPVENGHFVLAKPEHASGNLANYPDTFFAILSNTGHGGEVLHYVLAQANADPRLKLTLKEYTHERFTVAIVMVSPKR